MDEKRAFLIAKGEMGAETFAEKYEAWQYLIDRNLSWDLDDSTVKYGLSLIEKGHCRLPKKKSAQKLYEEAKKRTANTRVSNGGLYTADDPIFTGGVSFFRPYKPDTKSAQEDSEEEEEGAPCPYCVEHTESWDCEHLVAAFDHEGECLGGILLEHHDKIKKLIEDIFNSALKQCADQGKKKITWKDKSLQEVWGHSMSGYQKGDPLHLDKALIANLLQDILWKTCADQSSVDGSAGPGASWHELSFYDKRPADAIEATMKILKTRMEFVCKK